MARKDDRLKRVVRKGFERGHMMICSAQKLIQMQKGSLLVRSKRIDMLI